MFELIIFLRFIVDYFWEYKILSILYMALVLFLCILHYAKKNQKYQKLSKLDASVGAVLCSSIVTFFMSIGSNEAIDFAKLASYVLIYYFARISSIPIINSRIIASNSLIILTLFAIGSILGLGYQEWGSVNTFTGGYYFKTDMAISALGLMYLCLATSNNRKIWLAAFTLSFFLVFNTNARIVIPIVIGTYLIRSTNFHQNIFDASIKNIAFYAALITAAMSVFLIIDFESLGLMSFDFTDPLSESNTQGRSVIWMNQIYAFENASISNKIFGSGFNADILANSIFERIGFEEGLRAHNSYLYTLISMGLIGVTVFSSFFYQLMKEIKYSIQSKSAVNLPISLLCLYYFLSFIILSFTVEVIVRPQFMLLLFYFAGLQVTANDRTRMLHASSVVYTQTSNSKLNYH